MIDLADYRIRGRKDIVSYRNIVLFGAGNYLRDSIETFGRKNIIAVLDNDSKKWGLEIEGVKVQDPHEFFQKSGTDDFAVVLSTSGYQYEIAESLVKNNWIGMDRIFSLCPDYQEQKMYQYRDILNNMDMIEKVYDLLEDEESKTYFINSLITRITHQPLYLKSNKNIQQSYCYSGENMICPLAGDYIMDCGAYIGDTAQIFASRIGNKGKIYCFEPFEGNYERLVQWIETSGNEIAQAYQLAVGNQDENRVVSANNQVSMRANIRTCENEKNEVYVRKIDSLYGDIVKKVDFIKMDVEGEEVNALKGAKRTIASCKPRMMISAYHETKHLWEIPLLIKEIMPEYKIYIGHQPHVSFEPEIYVKC